MYDCHDENQKQQILAFNVVKCLTMKVDKNT